MANYSNNGKRPGFRMSPMGPSPASSSASASGLPTPKAVGKSGTPSKLKSNGGALIAMVVLSLVFGIAGLYVSYAFLNMDTTTYFIICAVAGVLHLAFAIPGLVLSAQRSKIVKDIQQIPLQVDRRFFSSAIAGHVISLLAGLICALTPLLGGLIAMIIGALGMVGGIEAMIMEIVRVSSENKLLKK